MKRLHELVASGQIKELSVDSGYSTPNGSPFITYLLAGENSELARTQIEDTLLARIGEQRGTLVWRVKPTVVNDDAEIRTLARAAFEPWL